MADPAHDLSLVAYGWAPGGYSCKCGRCGARHEDSDKRSPVCRPCAEAARDKHMAEVKPAVEWVKPSKKPMDDAMLTFTTAELWALNKAARGAHVMSGEVGPLNTALAKLKSAIDQLGEPT